MFKCSKYVKLGVKRDKKEKVAPHAMLKQSCHQCPTIPLLLRPTTSSARYLSCSDRRSEASHTTIVTILCGCCQTFWAWATVASSLSFWLMWSLILKKAREVFWVGREVWVKIQDCLNYSNFILFSELTRLYHNDVWGKLKHQPWVIWHGDNINKRRCSHVSTIVLGFLAFFYHFRDGYW